MTTARRGSGWRLVAAWGGIALLIGGCSTLHHRQARAPRTRTTVGSSASTPAPPVSPESAITSAPPGSVPRSGTSSNFGGVHVSGDQIVDGAGKRIELVGFNDSAASTCIRTGGTVFVNGMPPSGQVSLARTWHADAVRIPLNEDCWLGINGVPTQFATGTYQSTIVAAVSALNSAGFYVILDLHWNAPGGRVAKGQELMADTDHSPAFWSSVAETFRTNSSVMFDLYNEPHGISWSCWRDGCQVPQGWHAAGMQSLVDAVRATGATQVLLLGGLGYSNDESGWSAYEPADPDHELAASLHVHNVDACVDASCWTAEVGPLTHVVPVVATEVGERDQGSSMVDAFIGWANTYGVGVLGWEYTRPYASALEQDFARVLTAGAGT